MVAAQVKNRHEGLQRTLRNRILESTDGRIQLLQIDVIDGCVTVRGRVSCYYHKQLAIRGLLDVLSASNPTAIRLDIQVATAEMPRPNA